MPLFGSHVRDLAENAFAGIVNKYIEAGEFPVDSPGRKPFTCSNPSDIGRVSEYASQRHHCRHGAVRRVRSAAANRHRAPSRSNARRWRGQCRGSTGYGRELAGECFHTWIVRDRRPGGVVCGVVCPWLGMTECATDMTDHKRRWSVPPPNIMDAECELACRAARSCGQASAACSRSCCWWLSARIGR